MKDLPDKISRSPEQSEVKSDDSEVPAQYASPACALHELVPDLGKGNAESAWASVNAWRKQQRQRLLDIRNSLSETQHRAMDDAIMGHLEKSGWLNGHAGITFYWPMPGEIDLRPLMTKLAGQGMTAALPVIPKRNGALEFWRWTPGETLSEDGLWGIPTPPRRQLVDVSLLLVPMLGFDNEGHRLGFGGGYYDRTIAVMQPAPVCIGVCYEAGHMHSIFPQDHDMPMHAIASEVQLRVFREPQ